MNPRSRSRRSILAAVLLSVAVLAAGCAGGARVSEYGDDLKANFIATCTRDVRLDGGSTVVVPLASEAYCECVYEKMQDPYGFSIDDLKELDEQVGAAEPGEAPERPAAIRNAMADCEGQPSSGDA